MATMDAQPSMIKALQTMKKTTSGDAQAGNGALTRAVLLLLFLVTGGENELISQYA